MSAPWVERTAAIVRGTPRLTDALCRGRVDLFDAEDTEAADRAAAICHQCPALQACGDWAATLRHNQAHGVLAAQHREWVSHPSETRTNRKEPPRP
jgi:hypothetical protein